VCAEDSKRSDKAQQAFGRKILCDPLLFAVDYHGRRSDFFSNNHRGERKDGFGHYQ
jgi:hypothetical protein